MMLRLFLLWFCGLLTLASSRGDTKFSNVRATVAKEYLGRGGTPQDKYFRALFYFFFFSFGPFDDWQR